jgi:uncharacterized RDD family membrane protein YckC
MSIVGFAALGLSAAFPFDRFNRWLYDGALIVALAMGVGGLIIRSSWRFPGSSKGEAGDGGEKDWTRRIGFAQRLAACCLDLLTGMIGILGVALLFIPFGLLEAFRHPKGHAPGYVALALLGYYLALPLFGLVWVLVEALTSMGPGKRLLAIRVAAEDGGAASRGQLVLRAFVKYPFWLFLLLVFSGPPSSGAIAAVCFILGIGYLLALGGRRQALHDRVAHTAVYRRDS